MIPFMAHNRSNPGGPRRAFTLTEMLVVVAILAILISTLFVAVNVASRRTQNVKTQFLMGTISSGLVQFNTDHGYYPPVLGRAPNAPTNPVQSLYRDVRRINDLPGSNIVAKQQEWYSYTTLAEYLLGFGTRDQDGYGALRRAPAGSAPEVGDREFPALGIRSPGRDGCWGAIDAPQSGFVNFKGYYQARNPMRVAAPPAVVSTLWNQQLFEGRVYGPYIDAMDERLIGGLTGFAPDGRPQVVTNDQGVPNFDQLPKVILDYWGNPISYYRAPYGGDDLKSNVPSPAGGFLNLGDVFCLREWEIDTAEQSLGAADANGDTSSSAAMKAASFALFSPGGDRNFDRTVRRDVNELNKDNVIQAGK